MGKLRVLDASGDTVVDWQIEDNEAVREAEALFQRLLVEERRMAFGRPTGGKADEAELIRSFDPTAEEILIVRPIQGG
jgi:hypothetical protein